MNLCEDVLLLILSYLVFDCKTYKTFKLVSRSFYMSSRCHFTILIKKYEFFFKNITEEYEDVLNCCKTSPFLSDFKHLTIYYLKTIRIFERVRINKSLFNDDIHTEDSFFQFPREGCLFITQFDDDVIHKVICLIASNFTLFHLIKDEKIISNPLIYCWLWRFHSIHRSQYFIKKYHLQKNKIFMEKFYYLNPICDKIQFDHSFKFFQHNNELEKRFNNHEKYSVRQNTKIGGFLFGLGFFGGYLLLMTFVLFVILSFPMFLVNMFPN